MTLAFAVSSVLFILTIKYSVIRRSGMPQKIEGVVGVVDWNDQGESQHGVQYVLL